MNPEQNYSPFEIGLGRLVSFDKADFVGPPRAPGRAGRGRPGPPARRPPARLVRHRGAVRRPGPAAGDLARPSTARTVPVFAGGRQVGKATSLRLEPDPQAGDRARLRPAALRADRHAGSRWSGRSRAAAAASARRSWSCRSSTCRASGADRAAATRPTGHAGTAMTDFARFDAIIDERLEDWTQELVDFCRIPSEGGDRGDLRAAADWTAAAAAPGRLRRSRSSSWARTCRRSSSASSATGRARSPASGTTTSSRPRRSTCGRPRRTSRPSATAGSGPAARPTTRASCCRGSGRWRPTDGVRAAPLPRPPPRRGPGGDRQRRPRRPARPAAPSPRGRRRAHRGRRARPRRPADGPGRRQGHRRARARREDDGPRRPLEPDRPAAQRRPSAGAGAGDVVGRRPGRRRSRASTPARARRPRTSSRRSRSMDLATLDDIRRRLGRRAVHRRARRVRRPRRR